MSDYTLVHSSSNDPPLLTNQLTDLGQAMADLRVLSEQIERRGEGLMLAVLRLLEADPHQFGDRPCQTCRAVTAMTDSPFGCCNPKRKNR